MPATPTLQSLALYAHDHFGEDGTPFEASIPSSFDSIVESYTHEAPVIRPEKIYSAAGDLVVDNLRSQEKAGDISRPDVDEFVRETLAYLRSQYPDSLIGGDEQLMLSHLFRRHLVEAGHAREAMAEPELLRDAVPR